MNRNSIIENTLVQLQDLKPSGAALIGLDGYVDKIQHPVQAQQDGVNTYFPSLETFGVHVQGAAGKSAQVELFTQTIKPGGNAPIMANALATLGIANTCLGTFGESRVEGVFQSMHKNSRLISLGKSAETNALEFKDGKLILSELSTFDELDWQRVKAKTSIGELRELVAPVNLLALVGWCNLPHATDIWRGFYKDIILEMPESKPKVFFDLADPTKRSDEKIMEVLELINAFSKAADSTLGLNENETIKLYQAICRYKNLPVDLIDLPAIGQFVFDAMDIDLLLVHPLDSCLAFRKQQFIHLEGKLVEQPKVTTGGGDNFNAGFCFGQMNGFSLEASMMIAMATSGAYVQNGQSPSIDELITYLKAF